jgi:hypothetical protein
MISGMKSLYILFLMLPFSNMHAAEKKHALVKDSVVSKDLKKDGDVVTQVAAKNWSKIWKTANASLECVFFMPPEQYDAENGLIQVRALLKNDAKCGGSPERSPTVAIVFFNQRTRKSFYRKPTRAKTKA